MTPELGDSNPHATGDGRGRDSAASAIWTMLLAAMAGGMGWGIRGQYGHETGAMIAGLLACLVLVVRLCPTADALAAARAVAWGTIAIGIGGSMTYGQTLGLTQNPEVIGNHDTLAWGLLGTAVKGGAWIGFGGLFLGMGLGGTRFRAVELLLAMLAALGLFFLGVWLLNSPYDPAAQRLPAIYFSATWELYPDAGAELRPRREVWGGLWLALLGLTAWAGWYRRNRLAWRLALWGMFGGALGFPIGQCLQAGHAWHPEFFHESWLKPLSAHLNWWNLMETTFGFVWGGVLALGLWLNRRLIRLPDAAGEADVARNTSELGGVWEFSLLALHVALLVMGEFATWWVSDGYMEISLLLATVPIVMVAAGRWWPWLMVLPVTLVPIAGKTLKALAYDEAVISRSTGTWLYVAVPLALACGMAVWAKWRGRRGGTAGRVLAPVLLLVTWLYFGLNFAFFRFPWPWEPWTGRTPHALIFTVCALGLTVAAIGAWRSRASGVTSGEEPGAGDRQGMAH